MKLTANKFIHQLKSKQSDKELKKIQRYFKADDPENRVIGVRMKNTFDLAKEFTELPIDEIEKLLDDNHEYVQKAVGSWIRHAGKQDEQRLLDFLEKHAPKIKRTSLTTMMEKLTKIQKEYYRSL